MKKGKNWGFSTNSVHAGEIRYNEYGAITTPIVQTSTFIFKNIEEIKKLPKGTSRQVRIRPIRPSDAGCRRRQTGHPRRCRGRGLFSSGMSAITTTLFSLLKAGDHIVITDDAYKRTLDFCQTCLDRFDIGCTVVKMCDYDAIKKAIKPNTRIFFSESPTNPYLNIMDLERLMRIFKGTGILVISDSTFATPYNQRPLEYGIDLVIHSATKYLGGHNDILSGVVLGRKKLTDIVREYLKITGGCIDPHPAYLLIRGLKTFELRMQRHNENGQKIAEFLESHPKVKRVYYPGLASHPHYKVAKKQMKGFGGVVTFEVKNDISYALKFMSRLKVINIGPSLGGVESLITHPATISYYAMSRKERLALGIKDGLIRLAVGVENAKDLIADLDQALI